MLAPRSSFSSNFVLYPVPGVSQFTPLETPQDSPANLNVLQGLTQEDLATIHRKLLALGVVALLPGCHVINTSLGKGTGIPWAEKMSMNHYKLLLLNAISVCNVKKGFG